MNRQRHIAQMMRAAAEPPVGGIPTNGLLNHWKLDQSSGLTIPDYGSRSITATVSTELCWVYDDILGRYVALNENGLFLYIDGASDDNPNDLTYVMHLYFNSHGARYYLDMTTPRRTLRDTAAGYLETYDGSSVTTDSGLVVPTAQWTQVVWRFTYATGNVRGVVDGVQGPMDLPWMQQQAFGQTGGIGLFCKGNAGNYVLNARSADALIYNRILSDGELSSIRSEVLGS